MGPRWRALLAVGWRLCSCCPWQVVLSTRQPSSHPSCHVSLRHQSLTACPHLQLLLRPENLQGRSLGHRYSCPSPFSRTFLPVLGRHSETHSHFRVLGRPQLQPLPLTGFVVEDQRWGHIQVLPQGILVPRVPSLLCSWVLNSRPKFTFLHCGLLCNVLCTSFSFS